METGWEHRLTLAVGDGDLADARRIVAPAVADRDARSQVLDRLGGLAAEGSATALELLVEIVDDAGLARAGVRRVLVDEDEVDEATQDTLISMTRSIGSFSPDRGRFVTWLFQIARYRAIDRIRRHSKAETLGDDMGDAQKISSMIATRVSVQHKVHELPQHYRDALVLRDIERLSYDAAADRLGMNVNTVKSHVARARAQLATMIGSDTL